MPRHRHTRLLVTTLVAAALSVTALSLSPSIATAADDPVLLTPNPSAPPLPSDHATRTTSAHGAHARLGTLAAGDTGFISGQVTLAPIGGQSASPATIEVRFSLQQSDGSYAEVDTTRPQSNGAFTSPALPVGTYDVEFLPDDHNYGVEHYDDARYFLEGTDVEVTVGATTTINSATLEPRSFDVGRVSGSNRFATGVEVSKALFSTGEQAPVVYLANGATFPDALAAGPAAIAGGGEVLTTGRDSLPAAVAAELKRVHPVRVVIVGGTSAVSNTVVTQVRKASSGSTITRIGGANRYATAELIVRDAFPSGSQTAYIATARNYADALAAGPAAGHQGAPLVLVDGNAAHLTASTAKLLTDLGVTKVSIVGGPKAVSAGIASDLVTRYGSNAVRYSGSNRYATAAAINEAAFPDEPEFALLATGTGFADALTGGPLAGAMGAPLYLTPANCLAQVAAAGIIGGREQGIILIGGTAVLSPAIEELNVCA